MCVCVCVCVCAVSTLFPIPIPIIIVIAGEALQITDYVSATTFLGTEDQSTTDQASFDPAVLIGWCLPAVLSLFFFVFTFTHYYDVTVPFEPASHRSAFG